MATDSRPFVSIIIPCLNEARFIGSVLADIQQQQYPPEHMEVIVVDGGSTDGTLRMVEQARNEHSNLRLLHNPHRHVPQAMNQGIRAARGSIIVRMDAHAGYPSDYVPELIDHLESSGASNVGGVWETLPRSASPKARAIARALTHPFGVGNAGFRTGVKEPTEVDTVPFGCFPREVFSEVGGYDERLKRNQDIELNKRIRARGGTILLLPHIHCRYYARDTFSALWKNNFANGRWVILTAFFTGRLGALSLRHFVPFLFVSYLFALIGWSLKMLAWGSWHPAEWLPGFPLFLYLLLLVRIAWGGKKSDSGRLYLCQAFLCLHISYGLGSWRGILDLLRPEIHRRRQQPVPRLDLKPSDA